MGMAFGAFAIIVLAILSPGALAGNCDGQTSAYPLCLCVPEQGCTFHCKWEAANIEDCAKFNGADAGRGTWPNKNQVFLDCDDSKVDEAIAAYGDCSAPEVVVPPVPGCFYDDKQRRLDDNKAPQMV